MSACIPSREQMHSGPAAWLNSNTLRNVWPVAAALAAMVATVYFGALNRNDSGLTRIASASAIQTHQQPVIRASQFRVEREQGYLTISGMAGNLSGGSLKNVEALVEFFDKSGGLVKSESALVDLPMLRGGEESPFTVQSRDAAQIASYRIRFREMLGASIPSVDR
jgi:hypothetical protein